MRPGDSAGSDRNEARAIATRTISTKLAIEGESAYRQSIKQINSEIKTLQSALQLTQSEFRNNANSMEALSAKHESLTKLIDAQKSKVQELQNALKNAQEAEQRYAEEKEKLTAKLQANREALEKLKASEGDTAQEEAALTAETQELERSLEQCDAKLQAADQGVNSWQQQLNNAQIKLNDMNAELELNDRYLDEAKNSTDGCATSIDEFGDRVKKTGDDLEHTNTALDAMATAMIASGVSEAADKIVDALKDCVSTYADFESTMSGVRAISGATAEEMELLTQKAKDLGASTAFTAAEVAEGLSYMALAGWDTTEMLEGIDGVISLAAASGEDLAAVSDIVTDALTAFGLSAQDTGRFVDVLASAAANSNTTVSMLGDAFKYAAPVAGALGYSVEDVAVAMGLMANNGIKGSQSGTALRNMFSKLTGEIKLSADAFGEVEVSAVQSDGSMMGLSDTIQMLRAYFDQMSASEKVANAQALVGERAYAGLLAILNTTEDDYASLADTIRDCDGAAQEMADIRLDNLSGQVTLMQSAMDGLKTEIGAALAPALEGLAEKATDALSWATDFVKEHPNITRAVALVATSLTGLATALVGIQAAKKAAEILELGEACKSAATGVSTFVSSMGAAGLGAIAVAVGSIVAGIAAIIDQIKTMNSVGFDETITSIEEAEANVKHWEDELESAREDYEALSDAGADLTAAQNAIDIAAMGVTHAREQLESFAEATEEGTEATEELTDATEEYADTLADEAEALTETEKTIENLKGGLTDLAEAYKASYDAAYSSISSQLGLFGEFAAELSEDLDSTEEMIQRWGEQAQALASYTENLRLAAEYGLDSGLIASLSDGSAESAAYLDVIISRIQELGGSTEGLSAEASAFVDEFNGAFQETEQAKEDFAATVAAMETDLDTALEHMAAAAAVLDFDGFSEAAVAAFEAAGVDIEALGADIPALYQAAIEGGQPGVEAALQGMTDAAESAGEDTVAAAERAGQELESAMETAGADAVAAFDAEFSQATARAGETLDEVIAAINGKAASVQTAGQSVGTGMIDGMILGITNRSGDLYAKITAVVDAAIAAAQTAADTHSPSKKTERIFSDVGEGMIVGLEKKKKQVAEKAQEVTDNALRLDVGDTLDRVSDAVLASQAGWRDLSRAAMTAASERQSDSRAGEIVQLLEQYLPDIKAIAEMGVYLDDGTLAGRMDTRLGSRYQSAARGNAV